MSVAMIQTVNRRVKNTESTSYSGEVSTARAFSLRREDEPLMDAGASRCARAEALDRDLPAEVLVEVEVDLADTACADGAEGLVASVLVEPPETVHLGALGGRVGATGFTQGGELVWIHVGRA